MHKTVDQKLYLDFEDVKKKLVFCLVNTERNSGLLEEVPSIPFIDLSIIFKCVDRQKENAVDYMQVHNVHLKLWDVTVDELFRAARENTPVLMPYELMDMTEVMYEIECAKHPGEYIYDVDMDGILEGPPMYRLSNDKRIDGAACLIYSNLVRDIAKTFGSSFYIIPSSVHELLLIPNEGTDEDKELEKDLRNMIKEINDTQAAPEEILSYSLYYYDSVEGKIIMTE